MRVYVYGIVSTDEAGSISASGVEGAEVRTVGRGELTAIVSNVQSDALSAAREVRAHWRVLEQASRAATVLPVRFGTVMESADDVCDRLLEPNAHRLADLLRALSGCVQLSLKGHYEEDRLLRDIVRQSPAVAELRNRVRDLADDASYYERIRLGELVADEVARRRDVDTRRVLDVLEPLAVAARDEPAADPNAAFNLAFLVRRDEEQTFGEAVGLLVRELGERVQLRFVGPLPPYSFTDGSLTAGSAGWA